MSTFKYNCPNCSKERVFTTKIGYTKAIKNNTFCNSCANSLKQKGDGKIIVNNQKICSFCKNYKDFDEFSTSTNGKLKSRCKGCHKIYNQKYHENVLRFDRYGISEDTFKQFFKDQKEKCAICNIAINSKNCHIDHDHKTDQVRGLLCGLCNKGLGQFKDSILNLENAIKYLKNK